MERKISNKTKKRRSSEVINFEKNQKKSVREIFILEWTEILLLYTCVIVGERKRMMGVKLG